MCTAVVHFSPRAARSSATMPHSFTSSMKTLKAGSSNWIVSTPSASSSSASSLRISANAIAMSARRPKCPSASVSQIVIGPGSVNFSPFFVCERQKAASARCTGRLRFGLPVTVGTSTT